MKKLKIFLLMLLVFSVFIPKTHASTLFYLERFSGTVHSTSAPYDLIDSYTEVKNIQTTSGQFLDFTSVYLESDFSRECDSQTFIYRIDYQLFGWHNTTKTKSQWVQFAKLIQPTKYSGIPNTVEVLGSVLSIPSDDKINISTFVKYTWGSSSDCALGMSLHLTLAFNDSASDLYFYNSTKTSNYYTIYDSAYEITNEESAMQVINDYYDSGSITQEKLDNIEQKLVDTNENLDEIKQNIDKVFQQQQATNNKLDSVNSNIGKTNQKLDSVNSNLNNVNDSIQDTKDYLTDDTAPSADINVLGNVQGILPEGPIDSLLNIPFKVLSILNSSFGGVCVPISGKFVFDSTLTIPCFSELFYNNVPDSIMIFINVVPTAFILIAYLKNLYKRVDRALSLETSADDEWGGI